jgi:hypothetical protein
VHFYSIFWRNLISNWASLNNSGALRAGPRRRAPAAPAVRASASGPRTARSQGPSRVPQAARAPRRLEQRERRGIRAATPYRPVRRGFRPDARLPRPRPYYGGPTTSRALRNTRWLPYLRPPCPPLREDATPRRPPSHRTAPAPWVPAAASPNLEPVPSHLATPPRALAPKETTEPLHLSSPARASPQERQQRLPPRCAAAGHRRPHLPTKQVPKSNPSAP